MGMAGTAPKRILGALMASAVLLASCGGGSAAETDDGPSDEAPAILRCIEERGGEEWALSPVLPDDAPSELETVYAIGPERGHIGVIMSLEPEVAERLSEQIEEFGEYRSVTVNEDTDVLIYDPGLGLADKMAIYDCAEA
jgi:hypothetical protein